MIMFLILLVMLIGVVIDLIFFMIFIEKRFVLEYIYFIYFDFVNY